MDEAFEPYIGPRPFEPTPEDQKRFFGRDQEVNEIISLLVSHPVTLLYAQSGAGKTSLLNAKLIPLLTQKGFEILPRARMRDPIPEGQTPNNVFVFNSLSSWSNGDANVAQTAIADFLKGRQHFKNDEKWPLPRFAIFDQFEELFTFHPDHWKHRQGFFDQLRDALDEDHLLRVVFVMREDYIAEVDPHVSVLPEKLKTRFRLERLREDAAIAAVEGPLTSTDLRYDDGVVRQLVRNLLLQPVRTASGSSEVAGEFVEPLHLQVVCKRLCESVQADGRQVITASDLKTYGDVDDALQAFYESTLEEAIDKTSVKEGVLRRWFVNELITPASTRGTIFRGPHETCGLTNAAVDVFEKQHLIRAELRSGERWYELSHDRMIEPIRASNRAWLQQRSKAEETRQRLEAKAAEWVQLGRGNSGLLDEGQLEQADEWFASPESVDLACSETLLAVVDKSRNAINVERMQAEAHARDLKQARELAKSQQQRLRQFRIGIAVMAALLLVMAGLTAFAFQQRAAARSAQGQAERLRAEADRQAQVAKREEQNARIAELEANAQRERAEEAASEANEQRHRAEDAANEANKLRIAAQVAASKATEQTQIAENFARVAKSRGIAYNARSEAPNDPELGLLLAIEAVTLSRTKQAEETLRSTLPLVSTVKMVLRGHTDWVVGSVFSPDGKLILTAGDKTARVWDAKTGTLLFQLVGHSDTLNSAVFSRDGRLILTTSRDGTAKVWSADGGGELRTLTGHTDSVYDGTFSPGGDLIVTASTDKTARVWKTDTGQGLGIFRGHTDWVNSAAFSPDGRWVVTASSDKTAKVWDVLTMRILATLQGHSGQVSSAAFSPDGRKIVTTSDDKEAFLWDVDFGGFVESPRGIETLTPKVRLAGHNGLIFKAAFSPDSSHIVTACSDKTARIFDATSGKMLVELRGHSGAVMSASFSPDGTYVLTGGFDKTARIWNWEENRELVTQLGGHTGSVSSASFSPDGRFVATASRDTAVRIWEVRTGRLVRQFGVSADQQRAPFTYAAYSRSGRSIVTASTDYTARIWNASTGGEIAKLTGHTDEVNSAEFSPDERRVVTASQDKTARVWDVESRKVIMELRAHRDAVNFATFSPDGNLLVTASEDGKTRVWNANTGELMGELTGHDAPVRHAEFSLDGRFIVTAGADRTATITRVGSRDPQLILNSAAPLNDARFSPDGKFVVVADEDRTVQVWDLITGRGVFELLGHSGPINSAVFSPDGNFIVSASADFTARIYGRPAFIDVEEVLRVAKERIRATRRQLTNDERKRFMDELESP